MENKEENAEAQQMQELGRRLSTATPNGATGQAAIAAHHELSGEDDAKREQEARTEAPAGTDAPKLPAVPAEKKHKAKADGAA